MSCSRSVIGTENAETFPPSQQKFFPLQVTTSTDRIPHMTETIHDRIKERLRIMDLSPQAASMKAGLSKDTLRKLLANRDQLPTGKTLSTLAPALEVSEQWLLTGQDSGPSQPVQPQQEVRVANIELPTNSAMPKDVPVLGTAAGSHHRGAFQLTSDAIDYVRRPPALMGTKDIYSLYVEGSSMEPQYWQGDLVYVHPHKPARSGDAVVVQCRIGDEEPDGTVEATIGLYVRRTGEALIIRKHNPPAEIEIKNEAIISYHKVLTMNELFGI
ncbi:phage repressor protein C with HTH and peptisase S24 domain [Sinorhizobium medicae]